MASETLAIIYSRRSSSSISEAEERTDHSGLDSHVGDEMEKEEGSGRAVRLNDMLDERFEVVHKLGWTGDTATVWLCRDHGKTKWCCVRVCSAGSSSEHRPELRSLRWLKEKRMRAEEAANHHLLLAHETFWRTGPEGRQLCLVLPVIGPSLSQWHEEQQTEHDVIRAVCRQMADAVHYLHSKGICHGDFRPGNIVIKVRDLSHLDKQQIITLLRAPDAAEMESWPGEKPVPDRDYVMDPVSYRSLRAKDLVSTEIAIMGFGQSFDMSKPPKSLRTPPPYAAPEVMFQGRLGPGCDIWALGCTMVELQGTALFSDRIWEAADSLELYLGPLPLEYREPYRQIRYQHERDHAGPDGDGSDPEARTLQSARLVDSPLEPVSGTAVHVGRRREQLTKDSGYRDVISATLARPRTRDVWRDGARDKSQHSMSERDIVFLTDLARKMLTYDVATRIRADDLLKHTWLRQTDAAGPVGLFKRCLCWSW